MYTGRDHLGILKFPGSKVIIRFSLDKVGIAPSHGKNHLAETP